MKFEKYLFYDEKLSNLFKYIYFVYFYPISGMKSEEGDNIYKYFYNYKEAIKYYRKNRNRVKELSKKYGGGSWILNKNYRSLFLKDLKNVKLERYDDKGKRIK